MVVLLSHAAWYTCQSSNFIIKHLDKRRLQRSITKSHKVRTETYSGAKIAATKHHIKPSLESQPDKIILHVGTNDIGNREATGIAEGIAEIGQPIK
jgi:lysophospholipase L1-like esterase